MTTIMWNRNARMSGFHKQGLISIAIVVLLIKISKLSAQEIYGKNDIWFFNLTEYQYQSKWIIGNELHFRYDDGLRDKQQFLIRPYISFLSNSKVFYTTGYTYINTYEYGNYALPATKKEHNVWEQINVKNKLGKLSMENRYRLEHRLQSTYDLSIAEFNFKKLDFSNRFRYRLTIKRPIVNKYFIQLFNEFWIQSNRNILDASFDRNWLYLGIGKKMSEVISMQIGYLHQNIKKTANRFERHPTLQVSLVIKLNRDNHKEKADD